MHRFSRKMAEVTLFPLLLHVGLDCPQVLSFPSINLSHLSRTLGRLLLQQKLRPKIIPPAATPTQNNSSRWIHAIPTPPKAPQASPRPTPPKASLLLAPRSFPTSPRVAPARLANMVQATMVCTRLCPAVSIPRYASQAPQHCHAKLICKKGNHYCNRDYGPGTYHSWHHSNQDGSYEYASECSRAIEVVWKNTLTCSCRSERLEVSQRCPQWRQQVHFARGNGLDEVSDSKWRD